MKANGRPDAWLRMLDRTEKGGPKLSLKNVETVLREAPEWAGAFAFDVFAQRTRLRRDTPAGTVGSEVTDVVLSQIKIWLDTRASLDASPETILRAVELVARKHEFHPVRDYLKGLRWDDVERLPTWLHEYLGAEDTPLHAAFGMRWLISAVARVFKPGCKADHVLILEGPQGSGKSSALAVLGDRWYSDQIGDIGTKDAQQQLQGCWIVELSELDALRRAEASAVKAFLTRTADRFRPPYDRLPRDFPRQTVFAGTVNHGSYLRDETGNRRFWPVAASRIDLEKLRRDRDHLWAEARARFERGEHWWLTPDEEQHARGAQDERFAVDDWEPIVERYLAAKSECTQADILRHLELNPAHWGQREQARVGKVLARLGWQRRQRRKDGARERYYARPAPPLVTGGPRGDGDASSLGNCGVAEASPLSPPLPFQKQSGREEADPPSRDRPVTGGDVGDAVAERAAILEFDGKFSPADAQALAKAEAAASHVRGSLNGDNR